MLEPVQTMINGYMEPDGSTGKKASAAYFSAAVR